MSIRGDLADIYQFCPISYCGHLPTVGRVNNELFHNEKGNCLAFQKY